MIYNKKNIARKTIARKTNPATRGSLKPQRNIIPDGTITNYTPHTISVDTNNRKNTVIRQNDLAIVTKTIPKQTETITEPKPRLIHIVACKAVNEYHSNQPKLKRFFLEEQAARAALIHSLSAISQNSVQREHLGHAAIIKLAKPNQKQQAKSKPQNTTLGTRGKNKRHSLKIPKRQRLNNANDKSPKRKRNVNYCLLVPLKKGYSWRPHRIT